MKHLVNLFSPETYEAFSQSSRQITGFRARHEGVAKRVDKGDLLLCYVTKVSRWCGLLEVTDGPFIDSSPIFLPQEDPFVVRFRVNAKIWFADPGISTDPPRRALATAEFYERSPEDIERLDRKSKR